MTVRGWDSTSSLATRKGASWQHGRRRRVLTAGRPSEHRHGLLRDLLSSWRANQRRRCGLRQPGRRRLADHDGGVH